MVRPADGRAPVARMVELRGVQPGFPFYGKVVARGRAAVLTRCSPTTALSSGRSCSPSSGFAVGDPLLVGGVPFTIRGVIAQEPGRRVGAFSFGSRVLVDYDDLMRTGLLSFGSRANYQILLKMNVGDPQPLVRTPSAVPQSIRQRAALIDPPRTRSATICCGPRTI